MFHFKHFSLSDEKSAMKVGMDAVLLGTWVNVPLSGSILDIGTGTGILALMMAQRSSADIDAVEIDEGSAEEALQNIELSPWKERISIFPLDVREFATNPSRSYDLIISNPPFFSNSLKSLDDNRNKARHDVKLPLEIFMSSVHNLLSQTGKLAVIVTVESHSRWVREASAIGLYPVRKSSVVSKQGKKANRIMLEFQRGFHDCDESTLMVCDGNGQYTEAYKSLTADFYLGL